MFHTYLAVLAFNIIRNIDVKAQEYQLISLMFLKQTWAKPYVSPYSDTIEQQIIRYLSKATHFYKFNFKHNLTGIFCQMRARSRFKRISFG